MRPDHPHEWLARARSNLIQAEASQPGVYLEDLCFQAHQAAEKSLKALLLSKSGSFPYTHDIGRLVSLVEAASRKRRTGCAKPQG